MHPQTSMAIRAAAIGSESVTLVDREASIVEASRIMRNSGIDDLLVTEPADGGLGTVGIVTARDIVTRVVAAELDPAVLTAGDIAWGDLPESARAQCGSQSLHVMVDANRNVLALVDGDGRLAAIVPIPELLRLVSQMRAQS